MRIFLTNLGKYNEDYLVGEWLELPCLESEIEECLTRIGIGSYDEFGCPYEEYFITDYESDYIEVDEYSNVYELNEKAQAIEDLSDYEKLIVGAYLDAVGNNIDDALNSVNDAIVHYDCDTMTDVAREYLEDDPNFMALPEYVKNYFDFEAYGRDMDLEGTFVEVENGIVEFWR